MLKSNKFFSRLSNVYLSGFVGTVVILTPFYTYQYYKKNQTWKDSIMCNLTNVYTGIFNSIMWPVSLPIIMMDYMEKQSKE